MIGPNMATMLAFVLTDAGGSAEHLADLAAGPPSNLQLRQRRGPHQHQRHAAVLGQRRWDRG